MNNRSGLVVMKNPFQKYIDLKMFRIKSRLPVIDGPISIVDLKNEDLKRTLYASIRSCMENKICVEATHFGLIDHPQFNLIILIVMQKDYAFTVLSDFNYDILGNFSCDYSDVSQVVEEEEKKVSKPYCAVMIPVEGVISVTEALEIKEEYVDCFPINPPMVENPIFGFDVVELNVVPNEILEGTVDKNYRRVTVPDTKCGFVRMPLNRYIPILNLGAAIEDYDCCITVVGGYVETDDMRTEQLYDARFPESYVVYTIVASSNEVIINLEINYKLRVGQRRVRDNRMKNFDRQFSRRCYFFFNKVRMKLEKMERNRLVHRNILVLKNSVIGGRMPSKELMNQSLLMVGLERYCSKNYNFLNERFAPYKKFEDWRYRVRQVYYEKGDLRNPMSVFDNSSFDYNGLMFHDNLGEVSDDFPVRHMRYNQYIPYKDYVANIKKINNTHVCVLRNLIRDEQPHVFYRQPQGLRVRGSVWGDQDPRNYYDIN